MRNNKDLFSKRYVKSIREKQLWAIYLLVKFKYIKTVEVEAKVVDTVDGSRRIGWTMLVPVYEYEYEGNVYRCEAQLSEYDSIYDVPKTQKLMLNAKDPYEFLEVSDLKISKGVVRFIEFVVLMSVVVFIYLIIVNNM